MSLMLAPRRVRATGRGGYAAGRGGYAASLGGYAAATDAAVLDIQAVGTPASGGKLTLQVTVGSTMGGTAAVSAVAVYASETNNVVNGHFSTGQVTIPAGGSAAATLVSDSTLSAEYVGQKVEIIAAASTALANLAIGTPVGSFTPLTGSLIVYIPVVKGTITDSPYFLPGVIAAGVLAAGGAILIATK